MSFSHSSPPDWSKIKADIIFIPAIGADPRSTWERRSGNERLDYDILDHLRGEARVHLYDHLSVQERGLQIPRQRSSVASEALTDHQRDSVAAFLDTGRRLDDFGVEDWASRLYEWLISFQQISARPVLSNRLNQSNRPVIFICHSTGGNVLKHALTKRSEGIPNPIAVNTIGITFFGVPHHGSSVLFKDEYVQTVQAQLGLKWKMSARLRQDFRLRDENQELERLNHRFALDVVGVKILNYVETADTNLRVLVSDEESGESTTIIRLCIVDSRSGKLGTPQVPMEDEDFMQLDVTHTDLPRFIGQQDQYESYLSEVGRLVRDFRESDRVEYRLLQQAINAEVKVHVHQFYEDKGSIKILMTQPTLNRFLEVGPSRAIIDEIAGRDKNINSPSDPQQRLGPHIEVQPASQGKVPSFKIDPTDDDFHSRHGPATTGLAPPPNDVPLHVHTQRPPRNPPPPKGIFKSSSKPAAPAPVDKKNVSFAEREPDGPQKTAPFRLPDRSRDKFRWIHVPFTHPGWVHQILGAISQDKENLQLHDKLLLDKFWFSQHNQSRHASPHARFVRPSVKCLLPENVDKRSSDGISTPSSGSDDVQLVAYMPYLHWDSFENMKRRANLIEERRKQDEARPIPRRITISRSTEHKLMWQYLTLDRPIHCRRTLDQYGYPSLRNTKARDWDQILWKRTQENKVTLPYQSDTSLGRSHSVGEELQQHVSVTPDLHRSKVLMVDQLWLWILDNETIVTFFPGREKNNLEGISREGDVRSLIYQDINGDYAHECHDPYDFAALAIRHAIRALLAKTTDRNLQVFRIFEEYISILTERQNESYKGFRDKQHWQGKDDQSEKHVHNREDLHALLELRDIEDELKTINTLIEEQQAVVEELLKQFRYLNQEHRKGLEGTGFLNDVRHFLLEHKVQAKSMRESTEAAKQAYRELLDMKQKQANVVEAHLASRQSKVAADQSRTVMIFTIFTIIFMPLSFFASVFGINSREWSGDGNNYLPLHKIFTYMMAISVAVIIVALLAAFSEPARKVASAVWDLVVSGLTPNSRRRESDQRLYQEAKARNSAEANNEAERYHAMLKSDEDRLSVISRRHTNHYLEEQSEKRMQGDDYFNRQSNGHAV